MPLPSPPPAWLTLLGDARTRAFSPIAPEVATDRMCPDPLLQHQAETQIQWQQQGVPPRVGPAGRRQNWYHEGPGSVYPRPRSQWPRRDLVAAGPDEDWQQLLALSRALSL